MGRDEETGSQVEQRNRPLPLAVLDWAATFFPFLCSTVAVSSSRPAGAHDAGGAVVKAGRCVDGATRCRPTRPRLDDGEHGVKLAAVGSANSADRARSTDL